MRIAFTASSALIVDARGRVTRLVGRAARELGRVDFSSFVKCFCRVSLWKESIWLQVRRSRYYSSSSSFAFVFFVFFVFVVAAVNFG